MSESEITNASYDLHLHTYWSYDATAHLQNHFERAAALGVRCLAITDHHVLDSLPDVVAMGSKYPQVCVIPSAELTVTTSIGAVDLLCYGFPVDIPASLQRVLDAYHVWQQETGAAVCQGMQALGHDYTDAHRVELLQSYRMQRTLQVQGHTHVSNSVQREYFVKRGFITSGDDYAGLLHRARQQICFPDYPAVDFVIPAVKELGVVVAIAHPHGYFAQGDRTRMDALRQECRLDGIECAHKSVPAELTPIYRAYCVEHGLFSSGGSDSHSDADIQTRFAAHRGEPAWLDELLARVGDRRLKSYEMTGRATESSMRLTAANPLAGRSRELRAGGDLREHIGATCRRLEETEDVLQALLPEEHRRDRLLREAAELQSRYPEAEGRPPLFGVLVGVKDIFHVSGFATRAGTALPSELFASKGEAACVTSLRDAGALVLGKTVTTEFAYFEPGPTRNPHDPAHTPGGSSSGSAAAVAAGFCPLALGTQTVGSVIRPAAFCGIVGFKPSYDRIDSAGLILCAPSVDTVGLFTQDARGMLLAAAAVCRDWDDATAASARPTLGVPAGPYLEQASAEGRRHFERQVTQLERAGYSVRRASLMADMDEINRRHRLLQAGEMAHVHREWFSRYEHLYRKRTGEIIREGLAVEAADLERARAGRMELREAIEGAMSESEVDMWICPAATGPAPRGLGSTGDPVMNLPWTHAGLPALSLPAGRSDDGLPLGLQCVAGYGGDEALLEWGVEMEEVLRA